MGSQCKCQQERLESTVGKQLGCTWIEVNNGGNRLWEMANIILKFFKTVQLKRFSMQMDDAWYMPDTKNCPAKCIRRRKGVQIVL
jgi:hypothetical protein